MTASDWASDIAAAKQAHIDGFAMNIASGDSNTGSVLAAAYQAAETAQDFKLFLSFDYLSMGAWDAGSVTNLINQYKNSPAQLNYEGKPLVSTFEGVDNVGDWSSIKASTGCFFMPSWSALGPAGVTANADVMDGAFSWAAWPNGLEEMTTKNDQDYMTALQGKPYMMAVSPWFYTNIPAWSKNWLWKSDDLWPTRWEQVIETQPAIVEIITWNDYGESHYIGPIHDSGIPQGANYVAGVPHDGWRTMLPYYIDAYKSGNATAGSVGTNTTATNTSSDAAESGHTTLKANVLSNSNDSNAANPEKISYWYKLTPNSAGSTDGTTGNDPNQGQQVYSATQLSTDKIFFSVLVTEPSDVQVQVGDNSPTSFKAMTAGINQFSTAMNGQTGKVTFTVSRNGAQVVQTTGPEIQGSSPDGLVNFNAYAGSSDTSL